MSESVSTNLLAIEAGSIHVRGLTFPTLSAGQGPIVLLVHGFPDGPFTFDHLLVELARRGYRGISVTLRGYAPSCQSALADSHVLAAAEDVVAIAETLGPSAAHLVGHDWGAVVTYLAGTMAPKRFRSLTTLAVPHPLGMAQQVPSLRQLSNLWYWFFFQLPVIAERSVTAHDCQLIEKLWRDWSPGYHVPGSRLSRVKEVFRTPGVVPSALAYYRHMLQRSAPMRRAQRLLETPLEPDLLALCGEQDGCIDAEVFERAMSDRWLKSCTVERMRGLGHFLHLEDPERVSTRIVRWIDQHA